LLNEYQQRSSFQQVGNKSDNLPDTVATVAVVEKDTIDQLKKYDHHIINKNPQSSISSSRREGEEKESKRYSSCGVFFYHTILLVTTKVDLTFVSPIA
jgi:hypothetical protein